MNKIHWCGNELRRRELKSPTVSVAGPRGARSLNLSLDRHSHLYIILPSFSSLSPSSPSSSSSPPPLSSLLHPVTCSYLLPGSVFFLCSLSLPNATPLPQCLLLILFFGFIFFVPFRSCIPFRFVFVSHFSMSSSQLLSLDFDSKSSYLDSMDAAFPYMENGLDYLQYPPQSPPAFDLPVGCKSFFQALIKCLICIFKCLPLPPPSLSIMRWYFQVITLTPLNSTHHLPSARILPLRPMACPHLLSPTILATAIWPPRDPLRVGILVTAALALLFRMSQLFLGRIALTLWVSLPTAPHFAPAGGTVKLPRRHLVRQPSWMQRKMTTRTFIRFLLPALRLIMMRTSFYPCAFAYL